MRSKPGFLLCSLLAMLLAGTTVAAPAPLRVVLDEHYPPYVMRTPEGALQGYLVDVWQLWAMRSGVRIELIGREWQAAQALMAAGGADVIDTISRTAAREAALDFTPPYAAINVNFYGHADLSRIARPDDLKGFVIGVKAGSACIDHLSRDGLDNMRVYPSYPALLRAGIAREVRVFCMGSHPADYLAATLAGGAEIHPILHYYTAEFHRAVHKGDAATLALVERGFAAITPAERHALEKQWLQAPPLRVLPRAVWYGLGLALVIILLLLGNVFLLRRLVQRRTVALTATKNQLATMLDALPDLLFELDPAGRFMDYRAPRGAQLVAPPEIFLGKTLREVLPPDVAEIGMAALAEAATLGRAQGARYPLDLADGKHWFELSVAKKFMEDGAALRFIVLSRDITERMRSEAQIQRMTKLYNALSQCNQAIVRCADEAELFPQICRDAVNFGGMRMAWIGSLDEASGKVITVASFGAGVEYLDGIDISIRADEPSGRGPSGIALREDHPVWCQDFQHDEMTSLWHQRGAAYGWDASAALPLHRKGKVVGVLTLYADTAGAFDQPAQNLLTEMAMDISYALDRFEDVILRQQVDLKIKRQAEKLASLLQISQELAGNIDLQAVLQTATARIAHLSSLKSSALYLLQDSGHLYLGATTPPLPPDFPHHLRVIPLADHPHIQQTITTRQPLLLADTASVTLTEAEAEVTRLRGLRTILYLPLLADSQTLGVLIVASTEQAVSLTEGEMELCRTLANLAAVAVKNAQLVQSLQQRKIELKDKVESLEQAEASVVLRS